MAILAQQVRWYEEVLDRPGVLREPLVMLGFQEIGIHSSCFHAPGDPLLHRMRAWFVRRTRGLQEIANQEFQAPTFVDLLRNRGLRQICVIDLHDPRSDLSHDMNRPIPEAAWNACETFIDIGSLEHVFDTRT